jgi:hypothetical protein
MWKTIWLDTDKIVEQRTVVNGVVEQRFTWSNSAAVDYQPKPLLIRMEHLSD